MSLMGSLFDMEYYSYHYADEDGQRAKRATYRSLYRQALESGDEKVIEHERRRWKHLGIKESIDEDE